LGGEPSPATPFQQYFVLSVGHPQDGGTRTLKLISLIFSPEEELFVPGDAVEVKLGEHGVLYTPR
jgi:hypothetical protein